jgi:cardiolipin synthase (CMP-forming)
VRYLPNLLTLIRLAASPVTAWLLLGSRFQEALALVLIAGVTDWLDGFAARQLRVNDRLGVVLDPLADKILLLTLFLTLGVLGLIKAWLLCLVIGRDIVIVVGALLIRAFRGIRQFLPSLPGKISTFFQISFVLMVLLHAAFPVKFTFWLEITALVLTTFFTAYSGFDYIRRGIRMATQPTIQ